LIIYELSQIPIYFLKVLAFNRCLQVISNSISSFLFEGIKTYFWLLISFLYALFCFCFLRPVLFSGIYFSWFYYPFVGYKEDINGEVSLN